MMRSLRDRSPGTQSDENETFRLIEVIEQPEGLVLVDRDAERHPAQAKRRDSQSASG